MTRMPGSCSSPLHLRAGTKHIIDFEMAQHTTAFLQFRFQRPAGGGSIMKVLYAERYESEPESVPE